MMDLTISKVTQETRSYWLARQDRHEWVWLCYENIHDGFGPFDTKREAIDFGKRNGVVSGK